MRIWILCMGILLFCYGLNAQSNSLQLVKGLPSDEVYDLLADSKGFIWAAHALGVSRYDGVNFKDFNHPQATSAGITDLVEDKQGRIWCHNFNGQVFYIENEHMYLLDAYKYKEEAFYPRMMILDDELLVTSQKGLFVLNTNTFKSKYLYSTTSSDKAGLIAIVNGQAYISNGEKFLLYERKNALKNLIFKSSFPPDINCVISAFQLQPINTKDTIYARYFQFAVFKFVIKKDTVILAAIKQEQKFINSVIKEDEKIIINTKNGSFNQYNQSIVDNQNVSDISIDNNGNIWYSSLDKGLLTKQKNIFWKPAIFDIKTPNDQISVALKLGNKQLYGTIKGSII